MTRVDGVFLDPNAMVPRLTTYYIGRYLEQAWIVESTQDEVRRRAAEGAPEGLVVVAERQTAGRGRKGDRWFSPAGSGLYLSLLLRPRFPDVMLIPLALGLAAAQAVDAVSKHRPDLKWPNDIMIGDRKLGGVIAESQMQEGQVLFVVAGIGINVSEPVEGWPPELASTAASLGPDVDREWLLPELLNAIEANYEAIKTGHSAAMLAEYRNRCPYRRGAPVMITAGDGVREEAQAIEIEADGSLLVEMPDGTRQRLYGHQVLGMRMETR